MTMSQAYADQFAGTLRRNWSKSFCGFISPPLPTSTPGEQVWLRTFIELARTYGWRKSELLNLRVGQVDLAARTIRLEVGETKNKQGREITMTQAVHTLLVASISGKKPDDYALTREDGKRVKDFRKAWRNLCAAAGVSGLMVHDMRRTGSHHLRRAGVAEGVIMKVGGWRTRSVFERYNIVDQSDIREAMHKLERAQAEFGHEVGHDCTKNDAPTNNQPFLKVN